MADGAPHLPRFPLDTAALRLGPETLSPAGSGSGSPKGTVLVIGAGFIGSHICRQLLAEGHSVRTLTRSAPLPIHAGLLSGTEVVLGNASSVLDVDGVMTGVDWVIFGAGGLVPAASQSDPIPDVILALKPLLTVLDAVAQRPGVAFTYLSSGGTVYGPSSCARLREDHPTRPMTTYGVLKVAGENFTGLYAQQSGIPIRILRCANVYGEGQSTDRGQGAVAAFLQAVLNGQCITLYGDGGVVRDFVHVDDVARVALRLRPDGLGGLDYPEIVNVGTGVGTSLADLLAAVENSVGRSARVQRLPARPFDVQRNVLDVELMKSLTGIEPIGLEQGLSLTVASLLT